MQGQDPHRPRVNIAAEDAILRHARLRRRNLIVMGGTRRSGGTLFGNLADAVLQALDRSVVFVPS
jgi:nucleotide-binding universal stress UspA family protein